MTQRMYVIKDNVPIDYDGIIGVDFLQTHHAKCNYHKRRLIISGKSLPLFPYQTYEVPARWETIINATAAYNRTGFVKSKEIRVGVFIGNCLVAANHNRCAVSIININEDEVQVSAPHIIVYNFPKEGTKTGHSTAQLTHSESESSYNKQTRAQQIKNLVQLQHLKKKKKL